jgi:drug/metabolite transporter superfamily protein YnfA
MTRATALLILLIAALLEAGGDALIRQGLRNSGPVRAAFFALGAMVLFVYGYAVNVPNWQFGKLLGIYVVFFFVLAQLIAWLVFHERPTNAVLLGGAFITVGGIIISYSAA